MAFTARTCVLIAGLVLAGCEDEPPQPEVGAATGMEYAPGMVHTASRVSKARLPGPTNAGADNSLRLGVDADTRLLAARLAAAMQAARPGFTLETVTSSELPSTRTAAFLTTTPRRDQPPSSSAAFPVALNALIVVVHPDNPLAQRGLTLRELARVFSARTPESALAEYWGDIGVAGEWLEEPITRYGTAPDDGLHAYLREAVLQGAPVRQDVISRVGSASVVRSVAADVNAIGYAGLPFGAPDVAAVPIAPARGRAAVEPSREAVAASRYPLAGFLAVHCNAAAGLHAGLFALLDFIYSEQGQALVAESDYLPLPEPVRAAARQRLGPTSQISPALSTMERSP